MFFRLRPADCHRITQSTLLGNPLTSHGMKRSTSFRRRYHAHHLSILPISQSLPSLVHLPTCPDPQWQTEEPLSRSSRVHHAMILLRPANLSIARSRPSRFHYPCNTRPSLTRIQPRCSTYHCSHQVPRLLPNRTAYLLIGEPSKRRHLHHHEYRLEIYTKLADSIQCTVQTIVSAMNSISH